MPRSLPPADSVAPPSSQHPRSVPHDDFVFPQRAIKRLLEVWKATHVTWRKVSSDGRCPLYAGVNFTYHHVWYVEACELNVLSLYSFPCNQSY